MTLEAIQWLGAISSIFFVFCFGAIVGSFLNVVVYRLPLGLNLVSPPSACPSCETRLPWKYNFPILGWLRVRGRCAFCKSKISPEYPIVELVTALLFAAPFALWFTQPNIFETLSIDARYWTPEWARHGFRYAWPYWFLLVSMFSTLIAVTLIDAKTFLIPLELPWLLGIMGLVIHPAHAWWLASQGRLDRIQSEMHDWTIPLAEGPWLGAAVLAGLGVALSALLLWKGWMPRSFADYEEWEKGARAEAEQAREAAKQDPAPEADEKPAGSSAATSSAMRGLFFAGPGVAGMFIGLSMGMNSGNRAMLTYTVIGLAIGLGIGLVLRRLVPTSDEGPPPPASGSDDPDDYLWTMYPHARREMPKELLFLLPALLLGGLGWWLTDTGGPLGVWAAESHIAIRAFGGSVLGLLVGGGLVWGIRIFGTLAFNKEAMGLGDVHLMAGVGAVLGWIDPTLVFFLAPFTGILWVLLSTLSKALFNRAGGHLPYGPQLALMSIAIVLLKPLAEQGLGMIIGEPVFLP